MDGIGRSTSSVPSLFFFPSEFDVARASGRAKALLSKAKTSSSKTERF